MSTMAPAALVAAPVRAPLQYGLFSVLTPRSGGRWESGVEFETMPCADIDGIGATQCDPDETIGLPKNLDSQGSDVGEGSPFTVYGHFNCSPVGWSPESAVARAEALLMLHEERKVENAFWTGNLGNTPNLWGVGMDTAPVVLTPATATLESVIATLEGVNGDQYGAEGIIHMTRQMAVLARAAKVVFADRGVLRTVLGTPVVAGAGYTGSNGQESDLGWVYLSGSMFMYRSDVFTSSNRSGDLLDRSNNDLFAVAERTYVLGMDTCGVYGAKVTP